MPKYKKRDPEYTAIQFTGSNIREVMEELGAGFKTHYKYDLEGATSFLLEGVLGALHVVQGDWVVVDRQTDIYWAYGPAQFELEFEPIKRVGRPPKEKK